MKKKTKQIPLNIQLFADVEGEPVTQTDGKTEGTGTEPVNKSESNAEKTFTQDEVNAIVMKATKNMPSKDELKEFNEWKESKKTEAQKQTELTQNNVDLTNRNNLLEQKLKVSDAGVLKEYRDFVQFTVSQMEGKFEENLNNYLKDNSQYLQKKNEDKKSNTTGLPQNGANSKVSEEKAYLDKKYANNPYYKK